MATGEQRPGKGCFFYGCFTFLVILVAVAIGTYFGTRKAVRMAVDTYLQKQPVTLPQVQLPRAEQQQLVDDVRARFSSAQRGETPQPLELSTDQLNAALQGLGWLGKAQGQLFFRIETNQLKADLSLNLDQFEVWRNLGGKLFLSDLGGRYLNGTALLTAAVTNGVLDLKITDILVNGKSLPQNFTSTVRTTNLADPANANNDAKQILSNIDKVEIKDDKLVVYFRRREGGAP